MSKEGEGIYEVVKKKESKYEFPMSMPSHQPEIKPFRLKKKRGK